MEILFRPLHTADMAAAGRAAFQRMSLQTC